MARMSFDRPAGFKPKEKTPKKAAKKPAKRAAKAAKAEKAPAKEKAE